MEYETAGDPISGLKWTKKTTEKISKELNNVGISVSAKTVGRLLKNLGFSLKSNVKNISNGGKKLTSEDKVKRDIQFKYIADIRKKFESNNLPVISADTKKKELIGNFKNPGTRYKKGKDLVNDHDFMSYCVGKSAPYGIYNLHKNEGFVVAGEFKKEKNTAKFLSADTPEFAAEAIELWWLKKGMKQYTKKKILILVDAGGSNGHRSKMWKINIQKKLCNKYNLEITICHYPPGASKWNPVEHRLFSEISKNWAGAPLINFETVLKYIKTTKTKTGLAVDAISIDKKYQKGIRATNEEMKSLNLKKHEINETWNYTLFPEK